MTSLVAANDGTHYVFVIDVLLKPNFDNSIFTQCLDAIVAFGNSFLMKYGQNKLTILGSSPVKNCVLFLDSQSLENDVIINDQQNEKFAIVSHVFRNNFIKWIKECMAILNTSNGVGGDDNSIDYTSSSLLNVSLVSGSISQGLCLINAHRDDYKTSRLLIFSLGADKNDHYSSQYMKLINCFFAAQKINIILDACSITLSKENEDSAPVSASMEDRFAASILQQGCDLTGGRYIRVHKVASLLEHLFWCLTPSGDERPSYVLPPKLKISPPAACFCHRKVLEIGYVCSVCVSIFCQYLPFCSTCQSNVFKHNLKQIANLKQLNIDD